MFTVISIGTKAMVETRQDQHIVEIRTVRTTSLRQPLKLVAFLRCHSFNACSPVCSETPARYIDLCT